MTKNRQRLEKLHGISKKARKLAKLINDECDQLSREILKQEEFAQECESRATNQTWDGKQPDFWYERGRIWRKATKADIGKDIIVGMFPHVSPLLNQERVAKLEHITTFGEFTTKDTKENSIIHWQVGWIVSDHEEMQDYRAGKLVSVVLADKFRVTKQQKQSVTEQPDPLIDGQTSHCTEVLPERKKPGQADLVIDQESFLKPEPGTVAEDKWRPKEGEKVQVINTDRVYEVEGFDKISKMVFVKGRSHGIELRLLKPYIEPKKQAEGPQPEPEPAKAPSCVTWYRDPVASDLANGPIDVEVCDAQTGDDHWEPRKLLAILPANIPHRYVTVSPSDMEISHTWRFARIKIGG